jgi:hypothetical protein
VKGPWKWSEDGEHLLDADGRAVLSIQPSDATEEEFAAIEAVPDLLAALKGVLPFAARAVRDNDGGLDSPINRAKLECARAAIAKAEGHPS